MGRPRTVDHDKIYRLYSELKNTKQVAFRMSIKVYQVQYALKLRGILRGVIEAARKYSANHTFFKKIDTEAKAYWLGFLMADGYINDPLGETMRMEVSLQSRDTNHIHKFRKDIKSTHPVPEYIIKKGRFTGSRYSRLSIRSDELCNDLIKWGCTPRKSLTLRFPDKLSKRLIRHFIRGYFDGDGSVYISMEKHWRSGIVGSVLHYRLIGTKEFLEEVDKNVGLKGRITQAKKSRSFELSYKRNKKATPFYNYLYKNSTIYMERKKKVFTDHLKQVRRKVKDG